MKPVEETPPDAEPEDPEVARGRRQASAVAVSLIGSILVTVVLGLTPLVSALLSLVINGLLLVSVFGGRAWARWVLAALTGLGAAANAWMGAGSFGAEGAPWMLSFGFAGIYAWCAFVLAFSRPLGAFVNARRESRAA